jgi:hypothetical protein
MSRGSYAPAMYRVLWFFGVPVRPPHFAGPVACGVFHTLYLYAIAWLLFVGLTWLDQRIPLAIIVIGAPAAGPIYGALVAMHYRYSARKHRLPHWSAVNAEAEVFD